jgi:hypothetical protein
VILTDKFIDLLIQKVNITSQVGLPLDLLAVNDNASINNTRTVFRPDLFMLKAVSEHIVLVILCSILLMGVIYWIALRIVSKAILGEHVSEHFRVVRPSDSKCTLPGLRYLESLSCSYGSNSVLLLNADTIRARKAFAELKLALYVDTIFNIEECLEQINDAFLFETELDTYISRIKHGNNTLVLIAFSGLDLITCKAEERRDALTLLSNLSEKKRVKLIIVAETKVKFYEYSYRVKQPDKNSALNEYWDEQQIIEFVLVQAGPLYRHKWELCTDREKLLLWQIAQGGMLNPMNAGALEHLVRRGYLIRHRGWHIINHSYARFILTAVTPHQVEAWDKLNKEGAWQLLKIPVFVIIIALAAVFYYFSGDSLHSYISIVTALLGLVPALVNSVNLVRGNSPIESD